MTDLQQFVYISRANFAGHRQGRGVPPEVGRILIQSRLNNPRRGLVGALYYGNGYFFQCLEGTPKAIDTLYADLLDDPRHRDLKVLHRQDIRAPSFSEWEMKYVPDAAQVSDLMRRSGMDAFDPYRFAPATVGAMVELLRKGSEGMPQAKRAGMPAGASRRRVARGTVMALLALAVLIAVIALHR